MVAFVAEEDGIHFRATCIGAESNVAISFAQFGGRALWASRLGNDELGRLVLRTVERSGVVTSVEWDDDHPTGVAVKEVGASGTRVRYYRSQSAARHLDVALLPDMTQVRWLHLTGITAALSPEADATLDAAIERARATGTQISFDVNLRRPLWADLEQARHRLLALCSAADVIFVGSDEARVLVGTDDAQDFAGVCNLSPRQELVFKNGPREAIVLHDGNVGSAAAHDVEVVDVTGAGDAFAAGYLAAAREQRPPHDRLLWGHWNAARVVQLLTDLPPDPSESELRQVRSLDRHPRAISEASE